MKSKALAHYGVLGMKWGIRRRRTSDSSDHSTFKSLKKKKLSQMTDDEIRAVSARLKLVKAYKESGKKGSKPISEMSNEELKAATRRGLLTQHQWRYGLRTTKKIKDMSDSEVESLLKRVNLEKGYKELTNDKVHAGEKLLEEMLNGYNPNAQLSKGQIAREVILGKR